MAVIYLTLPICCQCNDHHIFCIVTNMQILSLISRYLISAPAPFCLQHGHHSTYIKFSTVWDWSSFWKDKVCGKIISWFRGEIISQFFTSTKWKGKVASNPMKKMVINSCRTAESRKRAITGAVHRLPPIGQTPLTVANCLFSFWMQPVGEKQNSRRRALISLWLDVFCPGSASLHEKCGHEPERAGFWDSKMHLRIFARTEVNLLPQKTSISCSWCSSFLTLHFFFFKM